MWMTCAICGTCIKSEQEAFREVRPFVNIKTHKRLDDCYTSLIPARFRPFRTRMLPLIESNVFRASFLQLKERLLESQDALEMVFADVMYDDYDPDDETTHHGKQAWEETKRMIDVTFPVVPLTVPNMAKAGVKFISLPSTILERLIGLEIRERYSYDAAFLSSVAENVVMAFQRGEMPIEGDAFIAQHLKGGRAEYPFKVPEELRTIQKSLNLGQDDTGIERILAYYAAEHPVDTVAQSLARKVLERKLTIERAQKIYRREEYAVTKYMDIDGLPSNKKQAVESAFSRLPIETIQNALERLEGLKMDAPKRSLKLNRKTHDEIKRYARLLHVPIYQLVTAALLEYKK